MRFHSWQRDTPRAPFTTCSPNLKLIRAELIDRWGMWNLGCYGRRPIRGGTAWSSHAFGAAQDLSYRRDGQHPNAPSRQTVESEIIPWLLDHHEALGIQRVHDYWDRRYWQVGRGWIGRPPGARNDHIHIEVTPDTWGWDTPIASRLSGAPAAKPKPPAFPGQNTRRGSKAKTRVTLIQNRLNSLGFAVGRADGIFGPRTHAGVQAFQKANGLVVDGIVGRNTWGALFG